MYLLLWPTQVDPVSWSHPKPLSLQGLNGLKQEPAPIERLEFEHEFGAEDVAIDRAGFFYGGQENSRIIRLNADGSGQTTFAETGGHPLGFDFDNLGNLMVDNTKKGLLSDHPNP